MDEPRQIGDSSTKMPKTVDETKIAGPKASNFDGVARRGIELLPLKSVYFP